MAEDGGCSGVISFKLGFLSNATVELIESHSGPELVDFLICMPPSSVDRGPGSVSFFASIL